MFEWNVYFDGVIRFSVYHVILLAKLIKIQPKKKEYNSFFFLKHKIVL